MSAVSTPATERAERRFTLVAVVVVAAVIAAEVLAGLVRDAVTDAPSFREKVETCLTERSTPFDPVVGDPVASSAGRGALRTTVEGNAVTVALGSSEKDAARVHDDYVTVGSDDVTSRLEQNRKVVFLWDAPPTASQHDFMVLCTLDAQE